MNRAKSAFTIVELLIVIVVIAILAAITIVAYNGIQQRARASAATAALNQAAKKIALWQVDNPGVSPSSLSDVGVTDSGGTSYQYSQTTNGTGYCITATVGTTSYYLNTTPTSQGTPTQGGCAGHGQGGSAAITNLVVNPSFEAGTSGWSASPAASIAQVSGSAPNGTKYLRVSRSTTGDAYATYTLSVAPPASSPYTLSFWIWADTSTTVGDAILFRHSTGTTLATRGSIPVTTTPTRIVMSGTSSATPTGTLQIILRMTSTVGQNIYYDGFMVTAGSDTYNYADGNSDNWVWNSTANNSTSTGPLP